MNLWELARIINEKRGGNESDFVDFLVIIRRWLDKNPSLSEGIMGNFVVSKNRCKKDQRFITLREAIMNKPIRKEKNNGVVNCKD